MYRLAIKSLLNSVNVLFALSQLRSDRLSKGMFDSLKSFNFKYCFEGQTKYFLRQITVDNTYKAIHL